jgi:DNA-binding XRE family transcriptional regulator
MSEMTLPQGNHPSADVDSVLALTRARRRLRAEPDLGRLVRLRAGLSQQQMADLVGVERSALARWERGERLPRADALMKYLALLDRLSMEAN